MHFSPRVRDYGSSEALLRYGTWQFPVPEMDVAGWSLPHPSPCILWAAAKETRSMWPWRTCSLYICWETLLCGKCQVFLLFTQTNQCVRHQGFHKHHRERAKRLSSLNGIWQMSSLAGTITGFPHIFIRGDIHLIARRNIVRHVGEPDQSREWI